MRTSLPLAVACALLTMPTANIKEPIAGQKFGPRAVAIRGIFAILAFLELAWDQLLSPDLAPGPFWVR
jgi:hypothetical protein